MTKIKNYNKMAKKVINEKDAARQENIEATVSATEKFYNENKKTIWGIIAAVLVIGFAVLAYSKFIYQPKCAEAQQAAYPAELLFQKGDYEGALNGDGNNPGFYEIISEYGNKAGKAMYLYAGLCELQLGNYQEAIDNINKYKGKDSILSARAFACQGDAYVELGEYQNALSCFEKAIKVADNAFVAGYLVKEGLVYEALGNNAKALECYNNVKENYPASIEAYDIDKYINKVSE